jgi:phenylacetate-CoA ligase
MISEIEFASPNEIAALQYKKVIDLINYVAQHSPFYQKHFAHHNIKVDSIKSLNDLAQIPVTTKDDLQHANWDFLCIPKHQIAEYTSTSGTLGKPVTIALSKKDVERLAYNEAISFACADGGSNDVYQLMLTLDRQFMAGMAYYEGIKKLGAGMVRVGPGLPASQWETIQRLSPTTLVAVPSFVVKLLEYAQQHNIDPNHTSVKKIVCIGESIRQENLQANVLAQRITAQWHVKLYGTYASTEMQTAFTECNHGAGGHLHPELLYVELLDENNKPVPEGETGEVTITTLGVEAMPLLRYKTGDMAKFHQESCACGRNSLRLGPIVGRKQQMLKLKGTTVYPPAVFEILNQQLPIIDYVVEAFTSELGTDEVRIFIHTSETHQPEVREILHRIFQSQLRVVPTLIFTDLAAIEKLNGIGINRKIRKFVDTR